MTPFEALCEGLNIKPGSKYVEVVSNLVNALIFDEERSYSDDEIDRLASIKFKKLFPYL